ncbi:MAG: hypothetical protein KDA52_13080 [Planctomycetaceae bacterium]|nr:hypothetical protein [Planctomycetaceae bacterium]
MNWKNGLTLLPMLTLAFAAGCGQTASNPAQTKQNVTDTESSEVAEHTHDGWWCSEHGIPEEQCGMCNAKLAAEFQKKGDWCKEHDRPESQCFICHPELEAQFAALYEAKYGKQPPKPTE